MKIQMFEKAKNFFDVAKKNVVLSGQVAKLQATVNNLTYEVVSGDSDKKYRGNPYTTPEAAITELDKKFRGCAQWGVQLCQNIINLRAAFAIGGGIKPYDKTGGKAQKELDFIKEFIEHNNLDEEGPQDFATEAEIEGRVLFNLTPNQDERTIDLRHIAWSTNKYTVSTPAGDYSQYETVKYYPAGNSEQKQVILEKKEFVYKKFAGRLNNVNNIMPKLGSILRNIEDLDKAYWDWRKRNKLFASPTPVIEANDTNAAKEISAYLDRKNWVIGKLLVIVGKFSMQGLNDSGGDSLMKEIESQAKIISGSSGVPVHFLGLPDLLSNRSTAENLMESLFDVTTRERTIWKGCYEEIFQKVLALANEHFKSGFDTKAVGVEIKELTEAQMRQLSSFWLPAFQAGGLTQKLWASKLPGVDDVKQYVEELSSENGDIII